MSERKVLNKYYPPDFDASKLPRVKREKTHQFTIRLMAPFNMRCKTCGEYIYRGKKFNAKKEDVIGKHYLGIQIYRFYIKCTKCLAEITFITDPASQDYAMENGAIRNFESVRLAEKQAEQDEKARKEEEANNPMKLLENRTRDSRREMDVLETLEDLREMNTRNAAFDTQVIIRQQKELNEKMLKEQEEEDEREIQRVFGKTSKYHLNPTQDEDYEEVVEMKRPKFEIKSELKDQKQVKSSQQNKLSSCIIKKKLEVKEQHEEEAPSPPPQTSQSASKTYLNSNKHTNPLASLCAYSGDDDSSNDES